MSSVLFYGPGARAAAISEADRIGTLLEDPIGDEGLKVAEARDLSFKLLGSPNCDGVGVFVIGPLDRASERAANALLKNIEQPSPFIQPILWTEDLAFVQDTIRSRCIEKWAGSGPENLDEELETGGREIVEAALAGRYWQVALIVPSFKGQEEELIRVIVEVVIKANNLKALKLWDRMRPLTKVIRPTIYEIIVSFLPEESHVYI